MRTNARQSRQKEAVAPRELQLAGDVQIDRRAGFDHIGHDQFTRWLQQPMPEPHQGSQLILPHVLDDGNHQDEVDRAGIKLPQIAVIQDDDMPIMPRRLRSRFLTAGAAS